MGFFIHYRLVCNLVLISFLALFLAKLTTTLVMSIGFTPPALHSEVAITNPHPLRETKDIRSYEKIIDRNIFDSEKHSPDEDKEPAVLEPPKPTLDLNSPPIKSTLGAKLVGTIVTSSKESSIAIIEKSGATDRYHIADFLDGEDGKITEILRNKVIFIRDFHREYLEIEDTTPEIEFVENYTPEVSGGAGFEGGITEVEKNRFAIDKTRFDKALKNINQILFNAASMPNIVDGKIEGFRILDIDPGSIFDELKITNDDIIISVNNKSLNDLKSVFTLFETLQKEKFFEIQVERDGERFTRTYEVK